MNPRLIQRLLAGINFGLGVIHLLFGFAEPVAEGRGIPNEGYFFLVISALYFSVGIGLLRWNKWLITFTALPLAVLAVAFTFLIAGGGWIWGPPREAQTYVFVIFSVIVAVFESLCIAIAFKHTKKETASV